MTQRFVKVECQVILRAIPGRLVRLDSVSHKVIPLGEGDRFSVTVFPSTMLRGFAPQHDPPLFELRMPGHPEESRVIAMSRRKTGLISNPMANPHTSRRLPSVASSA
jgi:hypothetical protein